MAIFISKSNDEYNTPQHMEFVMDYDNDVNLLPGLETCAPGSKATSIESGKVFYLTTFGFWTASSKALITEELNVGEPGTYIADEGKAFNPVIVSVGGGNPNYVETISGTVANPWGAANYRELINGISSNELTVAMTISGISLNASVINGILFSIVWFHQAEGTEPNKGASVFYSNFDEGALTIAKAYYSTEGWGNLPTEMPTTLTIIHHPLPDTP